MKLLRTLCVMVGLTVAGMIAAGLQVPEQPEAHADDSQRFGALMEESMHVMHQRMHASAGPDTNDAAFVRMMIPHHEGAVQMARAILLHGKDREIRRLAMAILAERQQEVQLMRLWLEHHGDQTAALTSPTIAGAAR